MAQMYNSFRTSRSRLLAASTALAATLVLAAPASSTPAYRGTAHLKGWNIGGFDHGALPSLGGQFYRALGWAKRAHGDVLRIEFYEPQMQDARDVRWMTRYLQTIHRLGIKIDLLLWDNDARMKSQPEQFAAACAKAAELWKGQLTAIEVGNEPNAVLGPSMTTADFTRADAQAAAEYVPVVKDSYQAIKQVAPHVTVLAGAIAFSDGTFLKDAYADGIGGYFDALSVHPYTYNASPGYIRTNRMFSLAEGLPWIRGIMAQYHDGWKKVWITEVGWDTVGAGAKPVSDAQRAQYVSQLGGITRHWPWLAAVIFYQLRNQDPRSPNGGWAFVSRSWKPSRSFWAFERTAF
jgi:hypothetical protein